jgi:hypothetical protein
LTVLREKMISMCHQYGIRRDMKAAKPFLEATDDKNKVSINKGQQTNFIQINGYTITADDLKMLLEEKQIQVQDILRLLNTVRKQIAYSR